jgi:hypothetical protein
MKSLEVRKKNKELKVMRRLRDEVIKNFDFMDFTTL